MRLSRFKRCRVSCSFRIIGFILLLLGVLGASRFIYAIHRLYAVQFLTDSTKQFETQFDDCYHSLIETLGAPIDIDSTGEYRIIRWPCTAVADNAGAVTLVSQCSFDQLHYLLDFRPAWQGPVSLAVFVAAVEQLVTAVEMLMMLYLCVPSSLHGVTVRLVVPLSPLGASDVPKSPLFSCDGFHTVFYHEQNVVNYNLTVVYPNNLLRNIGLDAAASQFVFVIDIDMIPNPSLFGEFSKFVRTENFGKSAGLIAYVVPVFEVKSNISVPTDRASLLQMIKKGDVQPFYHDVCWKCQRQTDYLTWYNLSELQPLSVGYYAIWHDPWEPFYILPRSAPRYDERFKQYGFNRISQSCELYIAGYSFAVLNNAFLVHRGFKTSTNFHVHKEAEQAKNRHLFRRFKEELKERYLNSERRC
jgi:N-acetyllactosaminide beta-1,3-N-acetylglucosaminyltransferase